MKPFYSDSLATLFHGDVIDVLRALPAASVQMCITSPPYWGLRSYLPDGHTDKGKELGAEPLHDCLGWATGDKCGACYICDMVAVFAEVKRILRGDGCFFLNVGDSHAATSQSGLKPKDLCMVPARLALALQADGWYLRSDIIWSKLNPMPESVTDRPTKAHEYLFLLTKRATYYYDADAVMEQANPETQRSAPVNATESVGNTGGNKRTDFEKTRHIVYRRNRRTVWTIATQSYEGLHFATFPEKLVEPCILAGTSERGCCPHCGAPWRRVVARTPYTPEIVAAGSRNVDASRGDKTRKLDGRAYNEQVTAVTTGWQQSCACPPAEPVPCTVLEPFAGSGTTLMVAKSLMRASIGIDLSAEYLELAVKRIRSATPGVQLDMMAALWQ